MHISETGNNNIKQIEYRSHMLEGENHLLHCLFYSFAIIKNLVQISKKSNKEVKKMYVSHVTESIKLTKINRLLNAFFMLQ